MNSDKRFETKNQLLHRLQEGISFDDGEEYTPAGYQKYASELTAKWKAAHYSTEDESCSEASNDENNTNPDTRTARGCRKNNRSMTADNLEQDYWDIVESQFCSMS